MKNKLLLIITIIFLIFPAITKAETYNTLNFKETLKEEGIELKNSDYNESDNQITIYLFRGKGCSHCRDFLNFMNSISPEYGKYFKLVSYEVWHDENNSNLLNKVSNYLGQPASGVPYIIIGDKVFIGYGEKYDDDIKKLIVSLYKTDKKDRYDAFAKMDNGNVNNVTKSSNPEKKEATINTVITLEVVLTILSLIIVITYINSKFKELNHNIETITDDKYSFKKKGK